MVTNSIEKPKETRDEAIIRLAGEARKRGIQIFTYPHTGEYFATSHRNPGTLHRVTLVSCDCVGFIGHGRCSHHSALLDHIGELPTINPDPTPESPIDPTELTNVELQCEACAGSQLDAVRNHAGQWVSVPCAVCCGRGSANVDISVVDVDAYEHVGLNVLRAEQCPTCRGHGYRQISTGTRLSDWEVETCKNCQGAGLIPVLAAPVFELAHAA